LAKEVELNTHELLLSQTGNGYTAFQLAAWGNHTETLLKMWGWVEETQLNPKVLKKELFLAKDNYGYIAWHRAAKSGSLEALEILWTLAKELELDAHEFLLSQTGEGYTAFQLAAQRNHVGIMELLLVFGRRRGNQS
jgi:ankyrin repeat protein